MRGNSEMESMLGFNENLQDDVVEDKKLVPWMSWDEWKFVRVSLFSSSPNAVASALKRISTWRSRGCIPVAIEVTASIIEIQQQDPYFRNELNDGCSQSEEMLSMLYCMAIVRLVNGMVEKTRKKNEISIGEAADAFGIPRIVIDVRHEGSHRDLPSLQLVRIASIKALDWLVWYYWEPQEKAIPTKNNPNANLRKEIKRKLREVALCLKGQQIAKSSDVKGRRIRPKEHLYGRSKFLILASGKSSHSNSTGSKKQFAKSLKNILRLYSSFSSEVVYILLEYLLNALDTFKSEQLEDSDIVSNAEDTQSAFDDWKSVVLKLSRKEPEFLVTLTQVILEKMESNETTDQITDENQTPKNSTKARQIELLSHLLSWVIGNLKTLKLVSHKESSDGEKSKTEKKVPMETVHSLLRKCLLISSFGNKQLMKSALTLSHLTGNISLLQKLKKLALLEQLPDLETNSVDYSNENLLSEQDNCIRQAAEDFEFMKQHMKGKCGGIDESEARVKRKWTLAKTWNSCPIGMLPSKIGFSGQLPVLDCADEVGEEKETISGGEEDYNTSLGKREADVGVEKMDCRPGKKLEIERDNVVQNEDYVSGEGLKGCLMIDGIWRKVGDEELFAISSAVKLLV